VPDRCLHLPQFPGGTGAGRRAWRPGIASVAVVRKLDPKRPRLSALARARLRPGTQSAVGAAKALTAALGLRPMRGFQPLMLPGLGPAPGPVLMGCARGCRGFLITSRLILCHPGACHRDPFFSLLGAL